MTEEDIIDHIAALCNSVVIFDHYDNVEVNTIHVKDKDGNCFQVTVTQEG